LVIKYKAVIFELPFMDIVIIAHANNN